MTSSNGAPERADDGAAVPRTTVAVCTRNNPRRLDRCLSALYTIDSHEVELLVVDNAPDSHETRDLIAARHPNVHYECEPQPGLNRARNRAVSVARGEIIVFVDDDVVVRPDWLEHLVEPFGDPDVAAVTGLVVPLELRTDAQSQFEAYGGFGCGPDEMTFRLTGDRRSPIPRWAIECGTGANMAFRRAVFDRIGGFDPALGVGTPTNGGDDIEMFFRILKEGYALRYQPSAVVAHEHRLTWEELAAQIGGWGSGLVAYLLRSARAYPEERWAMTSLGIAWVTEQLRRLAASVFRYPGFPKRLILIELRGAAQGFGRYRRSRRESESKSDDRDERASAMAT